MSYSSLVRQKIVPDLNTGLRRIFEYCFPLEDPTRQASLWCSKWSEQRPRYQNRAIIPAGSQQFGERTARILDHRTGRARGSPEWPHDSRLGRANTASLPPPLAISTPNPTEFGPIADSLGSLCDFSKMSQIGTAGFSEYSCRRGKTPAIVGASDLRQTRSRQAAVGAPRSRVRSSPRMRFALPRNTRPLRFSRRCRGIGSKSSYSHAT